MPHERFRYRTLAALQERITELGVAIPLQEDVAPLHRRVAIAGRQTPNALGIQPMEGCDGQADGSPGELTTRRYLRFARGGAGLLWFEATAILPEARANPRQLWLHAGSASALARLREEALAAGRQANGADYRPFTVLQLTHSGRYSRPVDRPAPILAHHDCLLDRAMGIPADAPLISDDALDRLPDHYVEAARLAQQCGFDGVDLKACHRYLLSELLAAHTRPGRYGGSFENRTRLLLEVVRRVRTELPGLPITLRLNVYDGHPFPWGWGVTPDERAAVDFAEPRRLIELLCQAGVALINVTAGNPYFSPHINRPFDQNVAGGYAPEEHPLAGVARLIDLARQAKAAAAAADAAGGVVIVGSGYSWLRHYLGYAAAGVLAHGWADIVAVGREAFAYPDFARDLLTTGALDPHRVCVACSRCTQIMRDHGPTGCAMLDRAVYGPIYAHGRGE